VFVDTDNLTGLTHDSTLKECLMAQVYFDPEVAQTIYQAWPAALHLKLKELALVSVDQLIQDGGETQITPVEISMTHIRALNELLCHFGHHIKHPDFTLSPEQVKRVLRIAQEVNGTLEEEYEESTPAFMRGYLTGMAFALGTTWQDLLRHAQYLNRNETFTEKEDSDVKA
jgi:hypothetical protein